MSKWSSNICGCCVPSGNDDDDNCCRCCFTCFFPFYYFGFNAKKLQEKSTCCCDIFKDNPDYAGVSAGLSHGLFFYSGLILGSTVSNGYQLLACPAVLLHAGVRYHMRKKYSINKDRCDCICGDFCCALCCYSCAIIQEKKQLESPLVSNEVSNSMMEYAPEVVNVRINCP
jgi:Cys-rich protein (TIGR01571 family)